MTSLTSTLFFLAGGAFVLFSIAERWILIHWYHIASESEHSWFFWGMNLPYIEDPDALEEFVKYRSKIVFFLGLVHLAVGVFLMPLPDFPLSILVWVLLIFLFSLSIRSHLVTVAIEINEKYALPPRPRHICPKCGKETLLDFKICPRCGEPLSDQDE